MFDCQHGSNLLIIKTEITSHESDVFTCLILMTHIFINQITKIALRCVIRFTCKAQLLFFFFFHRNISVSVHASILQDGTKKVKHFYSQ